jgi:hypothetical protein
LAKGRGSREPRRAGKPSSAAGRDHTAHPQFGGQTHASQPHAVPQQQRATPVPVSVLVSVLVERHVHVLV